MKVSQGLAQVRDGVPIGYTLDGDARASRRAVLVHSLAMDGASGTPSPGGSAAMLQRFPQPWRCS